MHNQRVINQLSLSDIFTPKGKPTSLVTSIQWPSDVWVYQQWSDPEIWVQDLVCSNFPRSLPDHKLMRHIYYVIFQAVSLYRYDKRLHEILAISDVIRQWNECVFAEYNISLSLLGYTENQYIYINPAAELLKSLDFFQKSVTLYDDGRSFTTKQPSKKV
jgi:hypothetical protein